MKITVRTPGYASDGSITFIQIPHDILSVLDECIISIDGSSTTTGLSIIRRSDAACVFSIALQREDGESPVRYKVKFKNFIKDLLVRSQGRIRHIYYEEPFIGYVTAVSNLMMLRTSVEEVLIENEPAFDYVSYSEINNKKWKKLFLAPDKCPTGTDLEKQAITDKLVKTVPLFSLTTQDERDAYAMGYVALTKLNNNTDDELESKKKLKKFAFNMQFVGGNYDDDIFDDFLSIYNGPKQILDNGITFKTLKGRENFEKEVCEAIGHEDKVAIIKFQSTKFGNIILENRVGNLSALYDYIYVIAYRKVRKR